MKKLATIVAVGACLAFSIGTSQAQFNVYSSTTGGVPANDFSISANTISIGNFAFIGDATLVGTITPPGGGFVINVPATSLGGGVFESSISGIGSVSLSDSLTGASLSGTIQLIQLISGTGINEPNFAINVLWNNYVAGTGNSILQTLHGSSAASLGFSVTALGYTSGTQTWFTTPSPTAYTGTITPAPVPEASTVVAGALMLLPLGIGAIRAVRKDRTV